MAKKPFPVVTVKLQKIVGGGQTLATMEDGRKLFVWGGLPGETVEVQITKKKSKLAEGVVINVLESSPDRIKPSDPDSYLSTSPWQIMSLDTELVHKSDLIKEAFELHDVELPGDVTMYTDGEDYHYRNKVEFSWYWNKDTEQLDLAFFRRGSHGKIPIEGTSLARQEINRAGIAVRDLFRQQGISAYDLKTLLIRSNQKGQVIVQAYVKNPEFQPLTQDDLESLPIDGWELIYSNPQSPASVVTERLQQWGLKALSDTVADIEFTYATEGFFQINLPVYEESLRDIAQWIDPKKPVVDLYSGVGSIGLTVTENQLSLVELNPAAVEEMKRNITSLGRDNATAVLAASEQALDYISGDATIILDPPRAGLHEDVVNRLLEVNPARIVYLSCNPVTQARDVAILMSKYKIIHHRGYDYFPHTPHIEHLVVLEAS